MSTFTWIPSFEATESSQPRVRKFQAGDGYEQRVRFGLNTDPKTWDLTFSERSDTEAAAIVSFFESCAGVTSFTWTPPIQAAIQCAAASINTTTNEILIASHGLTTGTRMRIATAPGGTPISISGVQLFQSPDTDTIGRNTRFAIRISNDVFLLAATQALATGGISDDISSAGSGTHVFAFTHPARKFVCEDWQVTMRACNFNTIRAKFREVFEP
jgi:phage-related protein